MRERRRRGGGPYRHATEIRFEAEGSGEGRGNADRAAPVSAESERRDPGRDGCGAAGARASRRQREVERIAGDAGQRRIADRLAAKLACRRLADQDRARRAGALDRRRIDLADVALHRARAGSVRQASDRDQVLRGEGQAVQCPQRLATHHRLLGGARLFQRLLPTKNSEGVERALRFLGAIERATNDLDRRQVLAPDEPCRLARAQSAELVRHRVNR